MSLCTLQLKSADRLPQEPNIATTHAIIVFWTAFLRPGAQKSMIIEIGREKNDD